MPRTASTEPAVPMSTAGVDTIKADDPDAQVIWATGGPKTAPGSKFYGVLTDNRVVLVHQLASGRFTIYDARPKASVNAPHLAKATAAA